MALVNPLSEIACHVATQALLNLRQDTTLPLCQHLLKLLSLDWYTPISNQVLQKIISDYPTRLTNELLICLAPPHITQLSLKRAFSITATGIEKLLRKCTRLESLDFTECDQLMRPTFYKLCEHCTQQLTSVSLEECQKVTDIVVKSLIQSQPNLKHLNLGGSENITDEVFLLNEKGQLYKHVKGPQKRVYSCRLESVDVSGCSSLTTTSIQHLTTLCGPTLKHINISWTKVDFLALWYLAGFSLNDVLDMAMDIDSEYGLRDLVSFDLQDIDIAFESEINTHSKQELFSAEETSHSTKCNASINSKESEFNGSMSSSSTEHLTVIPARQGLTWFVHLTPILHFSFHTEQHDSTAFKRPCGYEEVVREHHKLQQAMDVLTPANGNHSSLPQSQSEAPGDKKSKNMAASVTNAVRNGNGNCSSPTRSKDLNDIVGDVCTCKGFDIGASSGLSSDLGNVFYQTQNQADPSPIDIVNNNTPSAWTNPVQVGFLPWQGPSETLHGEVASGSDLNETVLHDSQFVCSNGSNTEAGSFDEIQNTVEIPSNREPLTHLSNKETNVCQGGFDSPNAKSQAITPSVTPATAISATEVGTSMAQTTHKKSSATPQYLPLYTPKIHTLEMINVQVLPQSIGNACLKTFFKVNSTLQKLSIQWTELEDEFLTLIAENSPYLNKIHLLDCDSLSAVGIANLGMKCHHLEYVDLQGVAFIGDPALLPIVCKGRIKALNLAETNVTDIILKAISKKCVETLEELDLSWCEELTEDGLKCIVSSCYCLRKLSVRQGAITDHTLRLMASTCSQLTHLNISSVHNITDEAIVKLSLHLPFLLKIDLGWNSGLTDLSVGGILNHCNRLEELIVPGIKLLTSRPFLPIISNRSAWIRCQTMFRLRLQASKVLEEGEDLPYSSDEEPDDIVALPHRSTSYATQLRYINLEYCDEINDTHMAEIVAICRGTLTVQDYYSQTVEPAWLTCQKGKVFLAPQPNV